MKKYFILYRPFFIFIASFFLTYIILTFSYQKYLSTFSTHTVDSVTKTVGINTEQVLLFFDAGAAVKESSSTADMKIIYNNEYVARITEGCNAVSIIILFVSFVVAFSGKLMSTLLFILCGSLIIYVFNVLRIAALTILIFHFPNQESTLHEVVFPLSLYGVVVILWLFWVQNFSRYAPKNTK